MIAIIDYKAGNVASVMNALNRIGAEAVITDKIETLEKADSVLFPGVGHASPAMKTLRDRGIDQWLPHTRKPVLGICLGMQLLFTSTEEGDTECLNIIPGRLHKFDSNEIKTPHMGWNRLQKVDNDPLFSGLESDPYFYFVHSFYAPPNAHTIASCHYSLSFSAVCRRDNFFGVQFHPEKSGEAGRILLSNFLKLSHVNNQS